jgi:hypothetical protein
MAACYGMSANDPKRTFACLSALIVLSTADVIAVAAPIVPKLCKRSFQAG